MIPKFTLSNFDVNASFDAQKSIKGSPLPSKVIVSPNSIKPDLDHFDFLEFQKFIDSTNCDSIDEEIVFLGLSQIPLKKRVCRDLDRALDGLDVITIIASFSIDPNAPLDDDGLRLRRVSKSWRKAVDFIRPLFQLMTTKITLNIPSEYSTKTKDFAYEFWSSYKKGHALCKGLITDWHDHLKTSNIDHDARIADFASFTNELEDEFIKISDFIDFIKNDANHKKRSSSNSIKVNWRLILETKVLDQDASKAHLYLGKLYNYFETTYRNAFLKPKCIAFDPNFDPNYVKVFLRVMEAKCVKDKDISTRVVNMWNTLYLAFPKNREQIAILTLLENFGFFKLVIKQLNLTYDQNSNLGIKSTIRILSDVDLKKKLEKKNYLAELKLLPVDTNDSEPELFSALVNFFALANTLNDQESIKAYFDHLIIV